MPEIEINDITGIATVGVTEQIAEVTVDEGGDTPVVEVTIVDSPQVIEVGVIGPQGPQGAAGPAGPAGSTTLSELTDVNVIAKVNKSVLVYDQLTDKFVANDVNTITTITDGGNF
jgi:hypothetical protein